MDERKNKSNRIKHGIWFEEAQSVFSDPHGRLFYDPEHSEHEDRFILLGVSSAARTLIVVHCYKENDSVVRIISARKATLAYPVDSANPPILHEARTDCLTASAWLKQPDKQKATRKEVRFYEEGI